MEPPIDELVQLPNGDWVRPSLIVAIYSHDYVDNGVGGYFAPRVRIELRGEQSIRIECSSFENACKMRDRIATLIAHAKPSQDGADRKFSPSDKKV